MAPYESLFLLPTPRCKACGTDKPRDSGTCPKCGAPFRYSVREKLIIGLIFTTVFIEGVYRDTTRKISDFKARKWCSKHGFQRTLTLPKDGVELRICTHCLAAAMVKPLRCPGEDYPKTRVPNMTNEPTHVSHASLERWSDSAYKSKCPACKDGLLLIYRDVDFKLVRLDRCVSCGQQVYYTDETVNGEPFSTTVGS
jgi:uncharacterized protein (DUF983 family)